MRIIQDFLCPLFMGMKNSSNILHNFFSVTKSQISLKIKTIAFIPARTSSQCEFNQPTDLSDGEKSHNKPHFYTLTIQRIRDWVLIRSSFLMLFLLSRSHNLPISFSNISRDSVYILLTRTYVWVTLVLINGRYLLDIFFFSLLWVSYKKVFLFKKKKTISFCKHKKVVTEKSFKIFFRKIGELFSVRLLFFNRLIVMILSY